jgi:hypothetical protein
MTDSPGAHVDYEARNAEQMGGTEAEWAVARLFGNVPLDVFTAFAGLARQLSHSGYDAYFKQETGMTIVWARRHRAGEDDRPARG